MNRALTLKWFAVLGLASLSIACETLSPTKICNLIYEKINHEL